MEKRITGRTGMFCLIGTPVGHSGSPAMYNYSFAQTGLDYAYLAYDVPLEKTEEAVNALKVLGCKGFNVTMQNKSCRAGGRAFRCGKADWCLQYRCGKGWQALRQ